LGIRWIGEGEEEGRGRGDWVHIGQKAGRGGICREVERAAMGATVAARDVRRKAGESDKCMEMEKAAVGVALTARGGIGRGQRAQGDGEGSDGGCLPSEEAGMGERERG
jgi:hypothetical protein